MGLVTKMHASLKQLTHSSIGQCHWTADSFFRFGRRGTRKIGPKNPTTGASAKA
jgi:hypothetical protein